MEATNPEHSVVAELKEQIRQDYFPDYNQSDLDSVEHARWQQDRLMKSLSISLELSEQGRKDVCAMYDTSTMTPDDADTIRIFAENLTDEQIHRARQALLGIRRDFDSTYMHLHGIDYTY